MTTITPAVAAVLLMAVVLYALARVLRGTVFGGVVKGLSIAMAIACVVTVISGIVLKDREVLHVLDTLLPAMIVCLVVVFQPEIRRSLLRIGRGATPVERPIATDAGEELVRAVEWLSRDRWGALVAWERSTGLGELIATGVPLEAEMRAETIVAVFTPNSPLHDGALVLRNDRVAAAACVLPLGEGTLPAEAGLRHRAALGLAEQTDAFVVVVSEESGAVSVAREGRLVVLDHPAEDLRGLLGVSAPVARENG